MKTLKQNFAQVITLTIFAALGVSVLVHTIVNGITW